jgi:hypothetical protein
MLGLRTAGEDGTLGRFRAAPRKVGIGRRRLAPRFRNLVDASTVATRVDVRTLGGRTRVNGDRERRQRAQEATAFPFERWTFTTRCVAVQYTYYKFIDSINQKKKSQ